MRALVLGAGRGLGRACAQALAADGAEVVLASRTEAELEQATAAIRAAGGSARHLVCDATQAEEIGALFASLDRLDVLVHAAGVNRPSPIVEMPVADLDLMLAVNVRSAYLAGAAAARTMSAGGSMVFISSQMGHVGAPRRTAYCATKHAVEGLVKAMAVELAPRGIRVNSVAPTFVETELTRPFLEDEAFRAEVVSRIPLGRLGTPAEVAAAVLFAAGPAARLITGTSIRVDGGWTAQ